MPLEPLAALMADARNASYAVGYFESWDLASLQGVIDAAEQTRSPIIIGFNGEFLSSPDRIAEERLPLYASLGRAAAQSASVPCGFIFNECSRDDWTRRAIDAGFNIVSVPWSDDDYAKRVTDLAALAHSKGVSVEAEMGELPCAASGNAPTGGSSTDPQLVKQFVKQTGIDLLAVSVGNIHIMLRGERELDLDRLGAIASQVSIPLVLHGGSGINRDDLQSAIKIGVRKVNYGTYMKQRCLDALRVAMKSGVANPHELLGMGGQHDLTTIARSAVRDAVLERIALLGCCGRA